jgi:hypothetical protein
MGRPVSKARIKRIDAISVFNLIDANQSSPEPGGRLEQSSSLAYLDCLNARMT